jgi:hypothetical protein
MIDDTDTGDKSKCQFPDVVVQDLSFRSCPLLKHQDELDKSSQPTVGRTTTRKHLMAMTASADLPDEVIPPGDNDSLVHSTSSVPIRP